MNISCVILNYNDAETTAGLIHEIQGFSHLNSVIVVDNLSTDDSYEVLKSMENNKVKTLQAKKNGGYGYGNNIGIRYAFEVKNADYVLIANPDVHFSNECVRSMGTYLEENRDYAVVAPAALKPDGERQPLIAWKLQKKWDYTLSASMFYLKFFSKKYYPESFFNKKNSVEVDVVPGSLLMVNASYMLEYGMYDENNFLYSEEEILAIKFKKKNLKTRLLLDETYIHEHSVSISKSFPSELKKKRMNLNSRLYVLHNYYHVNGSEAKIIHLYSKLAFLENKLIFKIKDMRK